MRTATWICPLALVALAACADRASAPPAPPPSAAPSASGPDGETVTLVGVARDAKAGAVVVGDRGEVVYLEGLASWPTDVAGRRVAASGLLVRMKHIPDPVRQGEIAQGAWGEQLVLRVPKWQLVP